MYTLPFLAEFAQTAREKVLITIVFLPIGLAFLLAPIYQTYEWINSETIPALVQSSELSGGTRNTWIKTTVMVDRILATGNNGGIIETSKFYQEGDVISVRVNRSTNRLVENPLSLTNATIIVLGISMLSLLFYIWIWRKPHSNSTPPVTPAFSSQP